MKIKQNKILKNILFLALATILYVLLSYILVYIAWSFFSYKKVVWETAIFKSQAFHIVAAIIYIGLLLVSIVTLVQYGYFSFSKLINRVDRASSDAFGNSRWQTKPEMKINYGHISFKNLPKTEVEGIVVSSELKRGELFFSSIAKKHGLYVGSSGSGKSKYVLGTTIQMNARSQTKCSMIINDLKGELFSTHSKVLKDSGYDIIKIDLRNPHTSDRYNPLSIIWDLYQKYMDGLVTKEENPNDYDIVSVYINEIASILCPEGTGDNQSWSKGAQSIIKSVIWALLEDSRIPEYEVTKEMFSILQLSNIVNRQKSQLLNFLSNRSKYSPVFDYSGMILDNPSEKTVGSYYASLSTALEGFLEEGIQKVTSWTDIDITKIATRPTAMFVIIPDELKTRNIVGTMIISQIYNYLTFQASSLPKERLAKSVYFFLDEFGNLPIIPNFPKWISTARGRNIFFHIFIQSDTQLEEVYNKTGAGTIIQSCDVQLLLRSAHIDTLKRFSDLFGKYTIYQRSANIDQHTVAPDFKGSTGLTHKELITLDQLQRIKPGTIYFKPQDNFPCHSTIIPEFDKRIENKFIFIGAINDAKGERYCFSKRESYYDLAERAALFEKSKRDTPDHSARYINLEKTESLDNILVDSSNDNIDSGRRKNLNFLLK